MTNKIDLGSVIGPQGPAGERGPAGPVGPKGDKGDKPNLKFTVEGGHLYMEVLD